MSNLVTPLMIDLCKFDRILCLARGGTSKCRGHFKRNPLTAEYEILPEDLIIYCSAPVITHPEPRNVEARFPEQLAIDL